MIMIWASPLQLDVGVSTIKVGASCEKQLPDLFVAIGCLFPPRLRLHLKRETAPTICSLHQTLQSWTKSQHATLITGILAK